MFTLQNTSCSKIGTGPMRLFTILSNLQISVVKGLKTTAQHIDRTVNVKTKRYVRRNISCMHVIPRLSRRTMVQSSVRLP